MYRSIFQEHDFDRDKYSRREAMIWLVSQAAWEPMNGFERGEVVASQADMARAWKWSRSAVRVFLQQLNNSHFLSQSTAQNGATNTATFTITNYERYQADTEIHDQNTAEEAANITLNLQPKPRIRTIFPKKKRNKEDKKCIRTTSKLDSLKNQVQAFDWPPEFNDPNLIEALHRWLEHKHSKRQLYKSLAPIKSLITQAQKTRLTAPELVFCIDEAISKEWQGVGFYPDVVERARRNGTPPTPDSNTFDMMDF